MTEQTTEKDWTKQALIIRNDSGILPNLDEYGIDVEAANDHYIIFTASPEQRERLSRDWEITEATPGRYPDATEGTVVVESDGSIKYDLYDDGRMLRWN